MFLRVCACACVDSTAVGTTNSLKKRGAVSAFSLSRLLLLSAAAVRMYLASPEHNLAYETHPCSNIIAIEKR